MTSLIDLTKASSTNNAAHQGERRTQASRASSWPPGRLLSTAAAPSASYEQVEAYNDQAVRTQHQPEPSNAAADGDTGDATDDAEAAATDITAAAPSTEERVYSPTPTNPAELRSTTPTWHLRAHLARDGEVTRDRPVRPANDPKLAAYMCRTLGLACAHQPEDLVYLPFETEFRRRYVSHAELWQMGQLVEEGVAKGWSDTNETERRVLEEASQHGDSGWRHTGKKPKGTACDVCGKTEGRVCKQQKTEGRDIFVRVVYFRCVGMRDEETGNVKRRVKRTFSYEPGDIMPDELGEVPAPAMARASRRELEASVVATHERLRSAREAEFMSFPRELTEAEAANIGAGWARSPEAPTVWVRV